MLSEIIKQKIQKEGPVSFRDFMEMSLYYPELGYYTSKQDKIGKAGDFYTSSSISPVFGAMIGKQIEEMWRNLGEDAFTIVEYGAGIGFLCHDILDYLKKNPKIYEQLNYYIIEKSPVMRALERDHLHEKVSWPNSIKDIPEVTGCILSNELIDNFSVSLVVMGDELMEVFVDYKEGFKEVLKPASQSLKNYLAELNVVLPKGSRTEINLEAIEWIKEVAASLKKGYLITIDYGYQSTELYRASRKEGTLVCYHKHQVNDNPYVSIGEQDITSHVNFSALCHWGLKNDIQCCGFTDLRRFLLALGFNEYLQATIAEEDQDTIRVAKQAASITHTLLLDMGSKFKVLMQRKGVGKQLLRGLTFS